MSDRGDHCPRPSHLLVPLETERGTFAMRLVILTESFLFISSVRELFHAGEQ